jgi:hypothetical protein
MIASLLKKATSLLVLAAFLVPVIPVAGQLEPVNDLVHETLGAGVVETVNELTGPGTPATPYHASIEITEETLLVTPDLAIVAAPNGANDLVVTVRVFSRDVDGVWSATSAGPLSMWFQHLCDDLLSSPCITERSPYTLTDPDGDGVYTTTVNVENLRTDTPANTFAFCDNLSPFEAECNTALGVVQDTVDGYDVFVNLPSGESSHHNIIANQLWGVGLQDEAYGLATQGSVFSDNGVVCSSCVVPLTFSPFLILGPADLRTVDTLEFVNHDSHPASACPGSSTFDIESGGPFALQLGCPYLFRINFTDTRGQPAVPAASDLHLSLQDSVGVSVDHLGHFSLPDGETWFAGDDGDGTCDFGCTVNLPLAATGINIAVTFTSTNEASIFAEVNPSASAGPFFGYYPDGALVFETSFATDEVGQTDTITNLYGAFTPTVHGWTVDDLDGPDSPVACPGPYTLDSGCYDAMAAFDPWDAPFGLATGDPAVSLDYAFAIAQVGLSTPEDCVAAGLGGDPAFPANILLTAVNYDSADLTATGGLGGGSVPTIGDCELPSGTYDLVFLAENTGGDDDSGNAVFGSVPWWNLTTSQVEPGMLFSEPLAVTFTRVIVDVIQFGTYTGDAAETPFAPGTPASVPGCLAADGVVTGLNQKLTLDKFGLNAYDLSNLTHFPNFPLAAGIVDEASFANHTDLLRPTLIADLGDLVTICPTAHYEHDGSPVSTADVEFCASEDLSAVAAFAPPDDAGEFQYNACGDVGVDDRADLVMGDLLALNSPEGVGPGAATCDGSPGVTGVTGPCIHRVRVIARNAGGIAGWGIGFPSTAYDGPDATGGDLHDHLPTAIGCSADPANCAGRFASYGADQELEIEWRDFLVVTIDTHPDGLVNILHEDLRITEERNPFVVTVTRFSGRDLTVGNLSVLPSFELAGGNTDGGELTYPGQVFFWDSVDGFVGLAGSPIIASDDDVPLAPDGGGGVALPLDIGVASDTITILVGRTDIGALDFLLDAIANPSIDGELNPITPASCSMDQLLEETRRTDVITFTRLDLEASVTEDARSNAAFANELVEHIVAGLDPAGGPGLREALQDLLPDANGNSYPGFGPGAPLSGSQVWNNVGQGFEANLDINLALFPLFSGPRPEPIAFGDWVAGADADTLGFSGTVQPALRGLDTDPDFPPTHDATDTVIAEEALGLPSAWTADTSPIAVSAPAATHTRSALDNIVAVPLTHTGALRDGVVYLPVLGNPSGPDLRAYATGLHGSFDACDLDDAAPAQPVAAGDTDGNFGELDVCDYDTIWTAVLYSADIKRLDATRDLYQEFRGTNVGQGFRVEVNTVYQHDHHDGALQGAFDLTGDVDAGLTAVRNHFVLDPTDPGSGESGLTNAGFASVIVVRSGPFAGAPLFVQANDGTGSHKKDLSHFIDVNENQAAVPTDSARGAEQELYWTQLVVAETHDVGPHALGSAVPINVDLLFDFGTPGVVDAADIDVGDFSTFQGQVDIGGITADVDGGGPGLVDLDDLTEVARSVKSFDAGTVDVVVRGLTAHFFPPAVAGSSLYGVALGGTPLAPDGSAPFAYACDPADNHPVFGGCDAAIIQANVPIVVSIDFA